MADDLALYHVEFFDEVGDDWNFRRLVLAYASLQAFVLARASVASEYGLEINAPLPIIASVLRYPLPLTDQPGVVPHDNDTGFKWDSHQDWKGE